MSDDLDTGDTGTQPDPVQQAKDNALGQMARSEDASAYIAERQDRQREDAGEQVNGEDRLPASAKLSPRRGKTPPKLVSKMD